jgi:hypothetical protein
MHCYRRTAALFLCIVSWVAKGSLGFSNVATYRRVALTELKVVRHDIIDVENGGGQHPQALVAQLVTFKANITDLPLTGSPTPELRCSGEPTYVRAEANVPTRDGVYGRDFWNTQGFLFVHPAVTDPKDTIVSRVALLQSVLETSTATLDSRKRFLWLVGAGVADCGGFLPQGRGGGAHSANGSTAGVPLLSLWEEPGPGTASARRRALLSISGPDIEGTIDGDVLPHAVRPTLNGTAGARKNWTDAQLNRGLTGTEQHAAMKGVTTFFQLMGKDRGARGKAQMKQTAIDARNDRQLYLTMMEVSQQTRQLSSAGVQTKAVFALVIDKLMNRMPEIMVQVLISVMREPFIHFAGHFLEANTVSMIAANSEDTPEVPVLANLPLQATQPLKAKAKCKPPGGPPPGEKQTPGHDESASEPEAKKKKKKPKEADEVLPCEVNEHGNVQRGHVRRIRQPSLIQSKETLVDKNYDQVQDGGENGGPIARVMPQLRKTVMHGLAHHVIPHLEAELSERITNRWDIVNNAILRNSVRWLAPGLTKTITTKSVAVLHKRIYDGVYKASRSGITRGITKKLTQAVVSSITHALTRNPRSDYYCYHCKTAKVYCKYCELAMVQQAHVGFYANYYSSYFGDYYGKMYDGAIGQHFAAKSSKVHWTKKRFL